MHSLSRQFHHLVTVSRKRFSLASNWPFFLLGGIVLLLFAVNVEAGTLLTGWDNLHPEFNFPLAFRRAIFSVWQEYQGLGAMGGHAYGSELIRVSFLWLFSHILPQTMLRYVGTFLYLFLGSAGAYIFIKQFFHHALHKAPDQHIRMVAFLGALFYLLNLSTIQTFYVPFEAFIAHYAALPWLLYASLRYVLDKPARTSMWLLLLILLLATPQAFIPTLFVVFMMALSIFMGILWFASRSKALFKRIVSLYLLIIVVNAFWLLPFAYFTLTNAQVNLQSKINQMATENIYLRNKEFGEFLDVLQLRGFWFENVDPNLQGEFSYMLAPWREFTAQPVIQGISYFFIALMLLGIVYAFNHRRKMHVAFLAVLLFAFIAMAISTTPFSWLNNLFRTAFPMLNQAFRFPFTKFSILTSLIYAVFLSLGIYSLDSLIRKRFHIRFLLICLPIAALLILSGLPAFQGKLLYEKERLSLPQDYQKLFSFFANEDRHTRIANFPQYTFWGWNFHRWGYGGSGFIWYGIEQPMLDRAFDVWSKPNENYYFALAQAVYSRSPEEFAKVLQKYDIHWLVIDRSITFSPSPKSLFYTELEELIAEIPGIEAYETFGDISIYKVYLDQPPTSFVKVTGDLPTVNTHQWNAYDPAYSELGDYVSVANNDALLSENFYPFKTLFTLKTPAEQEFGMKETSDAIVFSQTIPPHDTEVSLHIPALRETETILPVQIRSKKEADTLTITAVLLTPSLTVQEQSFKTESIEIPLFKVNQTKRNAERFPLRVTAHGLVQFPIYDQTDDVGVTFITLTQDTVFQLEDVSQAVLQNATITSEYVQHLSQLSARTITIPAATSEQTLKVSTPKIQDPYLSIRATGKANIDTRNCDTFRQGKTTFTETTDQGEPAMILSATNATACTAFFGSSLLHDIGYALFTRTKHSTGQELLFWVQNIDQRYSPLSTFLSRDSQPVTTAFILPPQDAFGKAYSFHFENTSIGKDPSENTMYYLHVYPVPYHFLSQLVLRQPNYVAKERLGTVTPDVTHPNVSLYTVSLPQGFTADKQTLILSQAYDAGWKAYHMPRNLPATLPFLFGKELPTHVMVNNWANGWILDNQTVSQSTNEQIVIVYLPQYLQFLGAAIFIISSGILILRLRK